MSVIDCCITQRSHYSFKPNQTDLHRACWLRK